MRRNGGGFAQSYGTVAVPGGPPVLIESAHPRAPATLQRLDVWRADLDAQPPATTDGPLRILLGDFNATLDHAAMRRVLSNGYTDAADALGKGLIATWGPYDGSPIPPVTIDHVLVDQRIKVDDLAVHDQRFSDHRAIVATVTLP
jgi:endonuclease/exonuclease/phosphatase family metal-dependent hydrolase